MKNLRRNLTPKNTSGQDLIEYALMAGFVAVIVAAILPDLAASVSSIFSQVGSVVPVDASHVAAATN